MCLALHSNMSFKMGKPVVCWIGSNRQETEMLMGSWRSRVLSSRLRHKS